ncbi:hypothetical protein OBBRIDRAFT_727035 [Obba rivulosa]|uniref:Uncharacterized protein n=1 Tax=Obba rivulosa TaxID=1052685 RepID=A0A8E2B1W1_9APHY|nr:hypothetical protein OBBRIDRAFT_727035 [Obba rivulosa]
MIWLDQKYEKSLRFLKKHWTLVILLFLATVVSCSIGIGWALRLHTFDGVNPFDFTLNANVFLSANLVDIDPQKQVMTLEWAIDGYQVGTMSNGSVIWCEEVDSCPDVAIYFDVNLLQTSSSSPGTIASNTKPDPIFILNGTNWQTYFQGTDYRPSSPYFRTDVAITDAGTRRTAQSYPFDKYTATLAIFAEAIPGNDTIGLYVERTTGIAVGFNAKLLDSGLASDNKTFVKNIEVTRGPVIRVYAIFIVMAIWVVTLTFLVAGVAVIFFGKGVRAEVLTLPVATLFAFTQLRSTLPGAPDGFGTCDVIHPDFVGILPCLALLTVCSVFMTAIFLFRNPEVNTSTYNVMFSDPSEPPSDEKRPLVQ